MSKRKTIGLTNKNNGNSLIFINHNFVNLYKFIHNIMEILLKTIKGLNISTPQHSSIIKQMYVNKKTKKCRAAHLSVHPLSNSSTVDFVINRKFVDVLFSRTFNKFFLSFKKNIYIFSVYRVSTKTSVKIRFFNLYLFVIFIGLFI